MELHAPHLDQRAPQWESFPARGVSLLSQKERHAPWYEQGFPPHHGKVCRGGRYALTLEKDVERLVPQGGGVGVPPMVLHIWGAVLRADSEPITVRIRGAMPRAHTSCMFEG